MLKKFNILLIIGLCLLNYPLHTKEINQNKESLSSNVEELAKEMKNLNSNLKLLSHKISNLVPK